MLNNTHEITNMKNEFCVFILTHGRADKVYTYNTLIKAGYTGKIFIVIDNEDKQAEAYKAIYKDSVLIFDKKAIAETFDEGDNFNDRRAIIYARNATFILAKNLGYRFFMQLDDDYTSFCYRFNHQYNYIESNIYIKSIDEIFDLMIDFYKETPFASIAFAQGGDFMGGNQSSLSDRIKTKRKAMNSFLCDTEKSFMFVGRINEDVNTYTSKQRAGLPFLTLNQLSLTQKQTQTNQGGMTDLYLDSGTFVKSFYSVMYAPACVKIVDMGHLNTRLHHQVTWNKTAPKILNERFKKCPAN